MVKVYLLSFRFPSENLAVKTRLRMDKKHVYLSGEADKKQYIRLKVLRNKFIRLRKRFMYQSDFGWFSFNENGVEEARSILGEAMRIVSGMRPDMGDSYKVDVIEVWLEPDQALKLLRNARGRLEENMERLAWRIRDAEEKRKKQYLNSLRSEYRMLDQKLLELMKWIRSLEQEKNEGSEA